MQKLEGRKTNCTNPYTLPTGVQRARALFGIVELTRPPSGGSRGQLRLSLTNTYHEWPVYCRFSRFNCPNDPIQASSLPSLINRRITETVLLQSLGLRFRT